MAAQIDIRCTGVKELESPLGIGKSLAQRILEYHSRHGPLRTIDKLAAVSGTNGAMVRETEDRFTVGTTESIEEKNSSLESGLSERCSVLRNWMLCSQQAYYTNCQSDTRP